MGVAITIAFAAGTAEASVLELEGALKGFLGAAGEVTCCGGAMDAWSVTLELAVGENVEAWIARLCEFLRKAGVRRRTFLAVFTEGWRSNLRWRRVEVYGDTKPG
jgi:hypothetical protein